MDQIIFTPRLKLTLVTKAETGSPELEWLHKLRSDEKVMWWSLNGHSKSLEDTKTAIKRVLPTDEGEEKTYRVTYAVHMPVDPAGAAMQSAEQGETPTEFLGTVTLKSLDAVSLPLPENLTLPAAAAATTLTMELSYMFLPVGWGKGYATEAVNAVFETCKKSHNFWDPFQKVYVRGIVNDENPASMRVMKKVGMLEKGVYHWTGKAIFIAGKWREQDNIRVYGMHLLE